MPPAVPKKPRNLSSSSPHDVQAWDDDRPGPLPPRPSLPSSSNAANAANAVRFPPPPRRPEHINTSQTARGLQTGKVLLPPKPRRPQTKMPASLLDDDDTGSQISAASRGLLDEAGEGEKGPNLSSWVPLKPS